MTIYLNEPKKIGEKIKTLACEIKHYNGQYVAVAYPVELLNDDSEYGCMVTQFISSSYSVGFCEKRLNKKTLDRLNELLIYNKQYFQHYTDVQSLAHEAAHFCM